MIVCVCNALNEKKIQSAIAKGATTPARVYEAHGTKKCCGQCVPEINGIIKSQMVHRAH